MNSNAAPLARHVPAAESPEYRVLADLLGEADVRLDGDRPWDVVIHDERMPKRVLAEGSIGVGESYMDGWWDCERLDEMLTRVMRVQIERRLPSMRNAWMLARLRNPQSARRAFIVG